MIWWIDYFLVNTPNILIYGTNTHESIMSKADKLGNNVDTIIDGFKLAQVGAKCMNSNTKIQRQGKTIMLG